MNLMEELQSLDPRDPGRWPLAVRAAAVGLCFLVLTGALTYFLVWDEQRPALPRIVTLHDIEIKSESKDAYDQLSLELTAKTYRYLDEDEIAAGDADKKKTAHHGPG